MPRKAKAKALDSPKETEYKILESLRDIFDKISFRQPSRSLQGARKINTVVAFSGGCDSVCLLRSLTEFRDPRKGELTVVHVHHGLSSNADEWAKFAEQVAKECQARFVLQKVTVERSGLGLEAEARRLRYLALSEVARQVKADAILTAHHRDDQLETFLIQWMRGAGIEGLAGMPTINADLIPIGRPFLNLGRQELEQYATTRNWKWVNDESNSDTNYLRNLIRLKILPVLDEARPGFRKAASRSIQLVAESAEILKAIDEADFQNVCEPAEEGQKLNVTAFLKLNSQRQSRVLRHWLRSQGIAQVPKHRIDFILRSLQEEEVPFRHIATLGSKELLLVDGSLVVENSRPAESKYDVLFQWKGEKAIDFPEFQGSLLFEESETGFPVQWLMEKPLSISLRKGKGRIKTNPNSPPKFIKVLCQEAGINPMDRKSLPVVRRGEQIIYVASLGMEQRATTKCPLGEKAISLKWHPNK